MPRECQRRIYQCGRSRPRKHGPPADAHVRAAGCLLNTLFDDAFTMIFHSAASPPPMLDKCLSRALYSRHFDTCLAPIKYIVQVRQARNKPMPQPASQHGAMRDIDKVAMMPYYFSLLTMMYCFAMSASSLFRAHYRVTAQPCNTAYISFHRCYGPLAFVVMPDMYLYRRRHRLSGRLTLATTAHVLLT